MPRPRTPIEQKIITNTYRPSVDGPLTSEQESIRKGGPIGKPKKPAGMSAEAALKWDAVLKTANVPIYPSHADALEAYCDLWLLWKKCVDVAMKTPTTQNVTPVGIMFDKLEKAWAKFGLSPKDQVGLPQVESEKKAKTQTRAKNIDAHLGKKPKK